MRSIREAGPGSHAESHAAAGWTGGSSELLALRCEELELALAAGRIGFCRLDRNARLLSASSLFKAQFGCAPDASIEWPDIERCVHADDRALLGEAIAAAIEGRAELDMVVRVQPAAGSSPSYVALRGRAVHAEDGTPHVLFIVATPPAAGDADEARRVDGARDASAAERSVARGASGDLFEWWVPVDADPGFTTLLASLHPGDRVRFEETVRAALDARSAFECEARVTGPDGGIRPVAFRGRVIADDERGARVIGVREDCRGMESTELELRRELERERRRRESAEAENRAKDEFLSMFSHELRSPLNSILGWNRILAVKRADDPEVASITQRVDRGARVQLKMVNDLLDLGRISAGKLRIEPRLLRLANVVNAALDAARPAAALKGIEISADFGGIQGEMYGDPDRLQQVVANLLSNAVKFTPPGGRIGVRLCRLGEHVELSVTDTGQGIDPALLPHVFDRFRQGDDSTTRTCSGLGLGLALVREIVALHGGSVSARSAGPGRGATFSVRLPLRNQDGAADGEEVSRRALRRTLEGVSVLVVDDEADARAVVAETLRLEGARVEVAESAAQALERLTATGACFDAVVTDIGMPGEDGYSLVRRLRAEYPTRRIVAIALTGYASKWDVRAAIEAGFDMHVAKPVDFDAFVPALRRLTAERRNAR